MSSKVFNNADGADFPEGGTEIGWTVQGVQLNPQAKPAPVFTFATNFTPSTRPGWTVQSATNGSNQSTVGNAGV